MGTVLRETTKRKLLELLERTYFTSSAFEIRYDDLSSEFVKIVFLPNRDYTYSISEPPGYNAVGFITVEAPGQHIESGERYKYDTLATAIKGITSWADRIHEDYRAKNPVLDELDAFRETVARQINEHLHDRDLHFTAEEANALRSKLDDLAHELTKLTERANVADNKLQEALAELEKVKGDLAVFPKGMWYQVASAKVMGAVKKVMGTTEGRQFALEAAKKLFLEGPK